VGEEGCEEGEEEDEGDAGEGERVELRDDLADTEEGVAGGGGGGGGGGGVRTAVAGKVPCSENKRGWRWWWWWKGAMKGRKGCAPPKRGGSTGSGPSGGVPQPKGDAAPHVVAGSSLAGERSVDADPEGVSRARPWCP